jgi:hypothetical protein
MTILQEMVQQARATFQTEVHDVVIVPDPDIASEEQLLKQSQATWYDLLERVEQACREKNKELVSLLQTHANHLGATWLAQAEAFHAYASQHIDYLEAHYPDTPHSEVREKELERKEQKERYTTEKRNMQRLLLEATVMIRDIPVLQSALLSLIQTGRYPDFD